MPSLSFPNWVQYFSEEGGLALTASSHEVHITQLVGAECKCEFDISDLFLSFREVTYVGNERMGKYSFQIPKRGADYTLIPGNNIRITIRGGNGEIKSAFPVPNQEGDNLKLCLRISSSKFVNGTFQDTLSIVKIAIMDPIKCVYAIKDAYGTVSTLPEDDEQYGKPQKFNGCKFENEVLNYEIDQLLLVFQVAHDKNVHIPMLFYNMRQIRQYYHYETEHCIVNTSIQIKNPNELSLRMKMSPLERNLSREIYDDDSTFVIIKPFRQLLDLHIYSDTSEQERKEFIAYFQNKLTTFIQTRTNAFADLRNIITSSDTFEHLSSKALAIRRIMSTLKKAFPSTFHADNGLELPTSLTPDKLSFQYMHNGEKWIVDHDGNMQNAALYRSEFLIEKLSPFQRINQVIQKKLNLV